VAPPASQYPRLADGTLVAAGRLELPAIPGLASPRDVQPPRDRSHVLPLLVPAVDADGNERAGIRVPEVAVPLATYTGWNFRSASIGGASQLMTLLGSSVPFPKTSAAREAARDPRRSIEERYPSKARYLELVEQSADRLVSGGYLLAADKAKVVARATEAWTAAAGTH
jgi:hypothetical protein